jgi:hypothetical protein
LELPSLSVGIIWDGTRFETPVIPAKAGIQSVDSAFPRVCRVDSRFRGNDCGVRPPAQSLAVRIQKVEVNRASRLFFAGAYMPSLCRYGSTHKRLYAAIIYSTCKRNVKDKMTGFVVAQRGLQAALCYPAPLHLPSITLDVISLEAYS